MMAQFLKPTLLVIPVLLLSGCSTLNFGERTIHAKTSGDAPYSAPRAITGKRKTGNPYTIMGQRYYPLKSSEGYVNEGVASWYGSDFHGKLTANGETYNMYDMTAAHTTLPIPTFVRVTNLGNNRAIIVRVNDRGPFVKNREIDLSYRAAVELGMHEQGTANVLVEALPVDGSALARPGYSFASKKAKQVAPITTPVIHKSSGFTHRIANKSAQYQQKFMDANNAPELADIETVQKQGRLTFSGRYHVQTGAFTSEENARVQAGNLKQIFDGVTIQSTEIDGRTFYRVRVGPLENEGAVEIVQSTLEDNGYAYTRFIRE